MTTASPYPSTMGPTTSSSNSTLANHDDGGSSWIVAMVCSALAIGIGAIVLHVITTRIRRRREELRRVERAMMSVRASALQDALLEFENNCEDEANNGDHELIDHHVDRMETSEFAAPHDSVAKSVPHTIDERDLMVEHEEVGEEDVLRPPEEVEWERSTDGGNDEEGELQSQHNDTSKLPGCTDSRVSLSLQKKIVDTADDELLDAFLPMAPSPPVPSSVGRHTIPSVSLVRKIHLNDDGEEVEVDE